ncbi:hypothetical protein GNF82_14365 [Clostridium perfringens]
MQQFANVKVTYDQAMNKWIKKKICTGKIDLIVATINAIYLLQNYLLENYHNFGAIIL